MPRREPLRKSPAPSVMMELPVLRPLTFAPLPYDTHPIDTYQGPQGWGPFYGPWTPWDFRDPAASVSYEYGNGESNDWQFAPDYDVYTVFADHSLDLAWNTSYDNSMQQAEDERSKSRTSTIANVVAQSGPSFFTRLRDALQQSPKE